MTDMSNDTYTYLGGSDPERINDLGMFSAAGTDEVADILENALDGASVADLKFMIASAAKRHPEIYDTDVREAMIGTLIAGSLADVPPKQRREKPVSASL